jgi:hypothetical protein
MSTNVFVSYDHDDTQQINGFKLLNINPNHPLDFRDHSLKEPVTNRFGIPLKYSPGDPRSKPVRDEIISKFENASKLVVLIGLETYTSEWVDWEIKCFYNMKSPLSRENTWKRIRGMLLKGHNQSSNSSQLTYHSALSVLLDKYNNVQIPFALNDRSTKVMAWDPEALHKWIELNPDA